MQASENTKKIDKITVIGSGNVGATIAYAFASASAFSRTATRSAAIEAKVSLSAVPFTERPRFFW